MKAENTTKIQFDSLSVNEAYARGAAAAFLARYDPTVPQLADLKTAVSEAVTNCIVHAYPDRVGPIVMTLAVYPQEHADPCAGRDGDRLSDRPRLRRPEYDPLYEKRPVAEALSAEAAARAHPHLR